MNISKITNKIVHINYPTQELLCKTFIRFQEYYESPKFKDLIFTLGEFKEYYAEVHGGFTYFTDWDGFNVPSYVLEPFRMGLFDPLTKEEKTFLKLFPYRKDPFYIIGTFGKEAPDAKTLKHEIAHGLFYSDLKYQDKIHEILRRYELDELFEYLTKTMGYHQSVWIDEAHTYILANPEILTEDDIEFPNITKQLEREYKKALQRSGV